MDYRTAYRLHKNAALQKSALFGIKPGALDNVKDFFGKLLRNTDAEMGKARRAAGKNSDDIIRTKYTSDSVADQASKKVDNTGSAAKTTAKTTATAIPATTTAAPATTTAAKAPASKREVAKKLLKKPADAAKWTGGKIKGGAKKFWNLEKDIHSKHFTVGDELVSKPTAGSLARGALIDAAATTPLWYPYLSRGVNNRWNWDLPRYDLPWMDATKNKPETSLEQAQQKAEESAPTNLFKPENTKPYTLTPEQEAWWNE